MLCPREKREAAEALLIGPHGLLSAQSTGRPTPEAPCEMRTCFQRDVDRITHSKSFRRLKHKTQVFLRPEGDHYRTRLTHTLEVARLARTIARALELNEDLTEAISLGHDLGHTPFGHAGERALNAIYTGVGFRHYEQSLRVVDRIERDGRGLNLCNETRIGILNHTTGQPRGTLEADLAASQITFYRLQCDSDGVLRSYIAEGEILPVKTGSFGGIVQPEDVPAIVRERVGERNSVRINSILTDIIAHSGDGALKMSPEMQEAVDVFTDFMYQGVYYNPIAKGEERKVQNILGSIWEYYVNHIDELPAVYQSIADDEGPQRAVCDYVSGMTDSYALEVYSELFIPAAWTIK